MRAKAGTRREAAHELPDGGQAPAPSRVAGLPYVHRPLHAGVGIGSMRVDLKCQKATIRRNSVKRADITQ